MVDFKGKIKNKITGRLGATGPWKGMINTNLFFLTQGVLLTHYYILMNFTQGIDVNVKKDLAT